MAMRPLLTLIFLACLFVAACGGGGGDNTDQFSVGNISGPSSVNEDSQAAYGITAVGDTGIGYQWAVDPPGCGTFTNQTSAIATFNAGKVDADTAVTIRVTVSSDHHSSEIRSVAVTIRNLLPPGWSRTSGGTGFDAGYASAVDNIGNLYVTGVFMGTFDFDPPNNVTRSSHGGYDAFLLKYNPQGSLQWVRTWGGSIWDEGFGLAIDPAGAVYVTGWFQDEADFDPGPDVDWHASCGSLDCFLSKFDADGNYQWALTWGSYYWDQAQSVAADASGNVYVTGFFAGEMDMDPGAGIDIHSRIASNDVFLSKFDSYGNYQWGLTWDGEKGLSVATDSQGAVYVSGIFNRTIDFNPGVGTDLHAAAGAYNDAFLSKFDQGGLFQWARTWGGSYDWDQARQVAVDALGGVYVTGYFQGNVDFNPGLGEDWHQSVANEVPGWNPHVNVFLSKFDSSGDFKWARTWGGGWDDASERLDIDYAGNVYVAGRFADVVDFDPGDSVRSITSNGGNDIFVSKFAPSGDYRWTFTVGGSGDEAAWGISVLSDGYLYLTGLFHETVDFDPGAGSDVHTAEGEADIFAAKIISQDVY